MPCRDYLLSIKEAVLPGIEEISLGLGASHVGSSSLWLEGCWSYRGTKLFRFQSTAAPSPHLACPWAQRYRLWSDKSLSCKGEEDWHWDRRGGWLPTKSTKPEDEMQCMQCALGWGLVRKERNTNQQGDHSDQLRALPPQQNKLQSCHLFSSWKVELFWLSSCFFLFVFSKPFYIPSMKPRRRQFPQQRGGDESWNKNKVVVANMSVGAGLYACIERERVWKVCEMILTVKAEYSIWTWSW